MADMMRDANTGLYLVREPERPERQASSEAAPDRAPNDVGLRDPARAIRIATMAHHLLDELNRVQLDENCRTRLKEIYDTSVRELIQVLSPELAQELALLSYRFRGDLPSDAEVRLAQAQLAGWLEGLIQGIQAMLFARHMHHVMNHDQERGQAPGHPGGAHGTEPTPDLRSGSYL